MTRRSGKIRKWTKIQVSGTAEKHSQRCGRRRHRRTEEQRSDREREGETGAQTDGGESVRKRCPGPSRPRHEMTQFLVMDSGSCVFPSLCLSVCRPGFSLSSFSPEQGDQMSLRKSRQNCCPVHFLCQKYCRTLFKEERDPSVWTNSM
jgi:hypothetical protein